MTIIYLILIIISLELLLLILVQLLKKNFKWIINHEDEFPITDSEKLNSFLKKNYSAELGWDRKPGTDGIEINDNNLSTFNISKKGYRDSKNDYSSSKIATFGDSYTFCRYVNDDETWQHYLEKKTQTHVRNFGVGNYGIDQAFLKFEKINCHNKEIIIFGAVPETITRIHSYWKHYLEFGNIFSFKPKFYISEKNEVKKIDNYLLKNQNISSIKKNINYVKSIDYFYKNKFLNRIFKFPYIFVFIKNFRLNIEIFYYLMLDFFIKIFSHSKYKKKFRNCAIRKVIMQNIIEADQYYLSEKMTLLLEKMIFQYQEIVNSMNKSMIVLIIPQKYDLLILKQRNYVNFYKKISKNVNLLDLTDVFLKHANIDSLYINDNYAGHLSNTGNQLVAEEIYKYIKKGFF